MEKITNIEDKNTSNTEVNYHDHVRTESIKNSFADEESLQKNKQMQVSTFPNILSSTELYNKLIDPNIDGFLKGFTILDNEGIRCDDEEIVNKQSGIISEIVKQLTMNIFKGLTSLSLPIKVFEPKTQLERDIEWWSFAPIFLTKAGKETDAIESLKQVTTFCLAALFLSTEQLKPFNPYLGETYQAIFEDGTQVYLEHTCHTPCISNYYMLDKENNYKFSGFFDLATEGALKMLINNSIIVMNKGKGNLYLKQTNRTLNIQFPAISISGLVFGQRLVSWRHMLKIEDHTNNLIVLVYFNRSVSSLKKKRVHDFTGGIYKYDFSKEKNRKPVDFYDEKIKKEPDSKYKIISIEGSYLEELYFNDKKYHDFRINSPSKFYPYFPKEEKVDYMNNVKYENNHLVIPSDSRYREDLIWLKRAFLYKEKFDEYSNLSGKWKLILEAQQRIDRENRKELKDSRLKEEKKASGKKTGIMNSINNMFSKK